MLQLIGLALVLGLGGVDPTAALIAVAALAAGATRSSIVAFGLTVMIGAPLFGSVLSLTVGNRLARLDWWLIVPAGRLGAVVGLAVGIALIVSAVVLVLRRPRSAERRRTIRIGTPHLIGAGLAYVGSLLIDPTFVAVTVLAGRAAHAGDAILLQIVWALISQLPLIGLLIAMAVIGRQRAADVFQSWWNQARPFVRVVVAIALFAVGGVLILDAGWWFAAGHFLLPDPGRLR